MTMKNDSKMAYVLTGSVDYEFYEREVPIGIYTDVDLATEVMRSIPVDGSGLYVQVAIYKLPMDSKDLNVLGDSVCIKCKR